MEKTFVSSRTVELAAEELPAFIAGLPRLLAEHLTVKVSGSLTVPLVISGFYGSGELHIEGAVRCTITNAYIQIHNCRIPIVLTDLDFQVAQYREGNNIVSVDYSRSVFLTNISINGYGSTGLRGVGARDSTVNLSNCCIKNCTIAVKAVKSSVVSVSADTIDGSEFSGNTTGIYVMQGSIITLANVPDTLGGTTNLKKGGLIVKEDGTLL